MVPDDDAVVVIDFQDALLAPAQYDLASLLNDRETDQVVTPAVEDQLIDYYLERTEEWGEPTAGPGRIPGGLPAGGPATGLQGRGRFRYLDMVKGKPAYNRYIAPR